jgi:hypothetical protein
MKRTFIVMGAAAIMAIASAFTVKVNDVFIKTTNPLQPCLLIACQQERTDVLCDIPAPVDGKYYQPGCQIEVVAFKPEEN